MKLPTPLASFIYKCDLFSTKVGFRFKQQRQYASLTGGVISILMICLFIGIFTNTGINTLNKEYIIATQNKKIYEDPSYLSLSRDKNFYFTLGLTGIDMNKDIRYFDVTMTYTQYINSLNLTKKIKNKVPLVACKQEIWNKFENQSIISSVSSLDIQKWLCPPENDTLQFKGKYTSEDFQYIKISVQKCNSSTDPSRRCATTAQLNSFLLKNQVFTLNFYFINTILNPEQKDHIKYYLEDKNYFPFTLTQGLTSNLYISEYNVRTDQSLLPVTNIQQNTGGIVTQNAQIFPYYITGTQYLKFYLRKSNQQLIYHRQFRRIDDFLSYIGGLFSSLLTFLLIVCFYNQLSYELQIAKNIYRYDKDTLLDTNGFHFLNYIIYLFYFILKLFGFKPNWQKMEHYDKSLIQVRKQMDVRLIFKKILFTEKLATALLSSQQLTALHLQDKIIISKAQQIRQNYFLPKLLIHEIQDKKGLSKNYLTSRIVIENNQSNSKSKNSSSNENSNNKNEENSDSNSISNATFMVRQQLTFDQNKSIISDINKNNQKITNSISAISFQGKTSQIYLKLVQIVNKLVAEQARGDPISKKILKGIAPQIKQLLDVQSSENGSQDEQYVTKNNTPLTNSVHNQSLEEKNNNNLQSCQGNKLRNFKPDQIVQTSEKIRKILQTRHRRGRKPLQQFQMKKQNTDQKTKQIKDILVIEDFSQQ